MTTLKAERDRQAHRCEAQKDYDACEARCAAGEASACVVLTRAVDHGSYRTADNAAHYYQRACSLGDLGSCAHVVTVVVPSDYLAVSKQCDAGDGPSCMIVATELEAGLAVERDVPRALQVLQHACTDVRYGDACEALAMRLEHLDDANATWPAAEYPRDRRQAATAYQQACVLGVKTACLGFARSIARGYSGPPDVPRASGMLSELCQGGNSRVNGAACVQLVELVGFDQARDVVIRACRLGVGNACDAIPPAVRRLEE